MILKIEIDTSGEAFKENPLQETIDTLDLAQIMICDHLRDSFDNAKSNQTRVSKFSIWDSNFNPCGTVTYE